MNRAPLSLSGDPFAGNKLVRFAFIDEAGTSKYDPYVVVAGVVVHGDDELIPLEEHLEGLARKHIPPEDHENFVFHMKDIWSGTKYYKNRDNWPIERRVAIMEDLVAVPERFEMPISFGFLEKAEFIRRHGEYTDNARAIDISTHAAAFSACTFVIEKLMREVWPEEIAQLVAEDQEHARATIRAVHAFFRDPNELRRQGVVDDMLPLQRIRGGIQFANKGESRPLQIADMCAFFIRGHLRRHPEAEKFLENLKRWMIVLPKGEESPYE